MNLEKSAPGVVIRVRSMSTKMGLPGCMQTAQDRTPKQNRPLAKREPGSKRSIATLTNDCTFQHQGYPMMLKRYSAVVLLSALVATAASAQECKEAGNQLRSGLQQLQSEQLANSEAATEYSNCVQDRGPDDCKNEYSKLQSAQDDLKAAVSEYKSERDSAIESGCVEDRTGPFGKVRPLGAWPRPPE
jgi:hypothetical protein